MIGYSKSWKPGNRGEVETTDAGKEISTIKRRKGKRVDETKVSWSQNNEDDVGGRKQVVGDAHTAPSLAAPHPNSPRVPVASERR